MAKTLCVEHPIIDTMYSNKTQYDQFYTNANVAEKCLSVLDMSRYDYIIEPSAGSGAFFSQIDHPNKIGLDVAPAAPGIITLSWFDYHIPSHFKNVLVVGNPPFGIRNQLSLSFITHALQFENVTTLAFILPNVFQKHTLQKKISTRYRLVNIVPLPKNSFTLKGQPFNISCAFFVFDNSDKPDLRFRPEHYRRTHDWEFGTKDSYDFFVMGASITTVKDAPTVHNRGYYIKVRHGVNVTVVKERFRALRYEGFSSASGGVAWVTKPELVKVYQEQFETPYIH